MTALQFAETTWLLPFLALMFVTSEKTYRLTIGLAALWLVTVAVLAVLCG